MSSPSAAIDPSPPMPGARAAEASGIAALRHADDMDSGEPIADLPPLIEPVAWEPSGHRPPRRDFLAPATPIHDAAPAAGAAEFDIPFLIEPVAAPPNRFRRRPK